jgi:hypothetical protein
MNKIEKIEEEIRRLSAEELAVLRTWLREYDSNAWDSEILVDASSGKLDSLADAALEARYKAAD